MRKKLERNGDIYNMTDRDWQFAFGDLGDPLADIEWWMLPSWKEELCNKNTVTKMPDQNGPADENQ